MRDTEALGAGDPGALEALLGSTRARALTGLAEAFRRWGWRVAPLDPLELAPPEDVAELDPGLYGLAEADAAPFRAAYCGALGWEIGHVQDRARYTWLARQAETPRRPPAGERYGALDLIARAELFERTLDRRLPGVKTFGLAGAESYLVLLQRVMARAVRGAKRKGIAGLIVDGGVRDREEIIEHVFPVFARHVAPTTGRTRVRVVEIGGTVAVSGRKVATGDVIVADGTGIVCIPQEKAGEVLRIAEALAADDAEAAQEIVGGLSFSEALRKFRTI